MFSDFTNNLFDTTLYDFGNKAPSFTFTVYRGLAYFNAIAIKD